MSSLRVLLIHHDRRQSDQIATTLGSVNHTVLQTAQLDEAGDALSVERFDAVLLASPVSAAGFSEFAAKLREVERSQHLPARIPIFSLSSQPADSTSSGAQAECDGYLEQPLDPAALSEAVLRLSEAVGSSNGPCGSDADMLPVLEPEKFEEQVCYDRELMVEIIDLFLEERQSQMGEMRASLASSDYAVLSRMAHTIKGSLGSLHAARAQCHAQELELAAKTENNEVCRRWFAALEVDLATLEPELLALRSVSVAH